MEDNKYKEMQKKKTKMFLLCIGLLLIAANSVLTVWETGNILRGLISLIPVVIFTTVIIKEWKKPLSMQNKEE